ncbi:hypothetical protein HD554DRAFT_1531404 [Boletus coccyginus]|nr:hypothetical protein HD554DRAFT_1531404 [Boletus coccyginus]
MPLAQCRCRKSIPTGDTPTLRCTPWGLTYWSPTTHWNFGVVNASFDATTLVFSPDDNNIGWQEWYLPHDMPFPGRGSCIYVVDVDINYGTIAVSNRALAACEKTLTGSRMAPTCVVGPTKPTNSRTLLYTVRR